MTQSSTTRIILLIIQCCTAPVSIPYFYWAIIVLILHRKNWSTPSVLIAMIHWIFCSLSEFFAKLDMFYDNYEEKNSSKGNWLASQVISACFNYSAQIVGDWYPMLLIVNQDKLCRYIKITCLIANFAKMMYMGLYIFSPFETRVNVNNSNFFEYRHYILIFISLSTILYHGTIFYYLRTRFCKKYKEIMKSQNFLTKFRRISQYRIMISSGYILCSTPFIIFYTFIILFDKRKEINSGEYARNTFFNVPYYIIYIDQILLKNLVVVKPTHNVPPPYLNNSCSANSETESKNDDNSTVAAATLHSPVADTRPQVTARPMLFNNWSAPQGWGKPEYMKPSEKPPQPSSQQTPFQPNQPSQPSSYQLSQTSSQPHSNSSEDSSSSPSLVLFQQQPSVQVQSPTTLEQSQPISNHPLQPLQLQNQQKHPTHPLF